MICTILVIDIDGTVDQAGLDRLRTHLNLTRQGRLTDEWDEAFGYRKVDRSAGQYLRISLYRDFDESWEVSVSDTGQRDPNDPEITSLRAELVDGITAAGYQATVRAKPNYGPRPPS